MFGYLDNNSTYYTEFLFLFLFSFFSYFYIMYSKMYNKKKKEFIIDNRDIKFNIILFIFIFFSSFYMSYNYNFKNGMSFKGLL